MFKQPPRHTGEHIRSLHRFEQRARDARRKFVRGDVNYPKRTWEPFFCDATVCAKLVFNPGRSPASYYSYIIYLVQPPVSLGCRAAHFTHTHMYAIGKHCPISTTQPSNPNPPSPATTTALYFIKYDRNCFLRGIVPSLSASVPSSVVPVLSKCGIFGSGRSWPNCAREVNNWRVKIEPGII